MSASARQLAFLALKNIYKKKAYTDIALDRVLRDEKISQVDRGLITELVYGAVRQRRTLDQLIDQLATKKAHQQPPDLRLILQLGLYQLRYLNQIPDAAAVNTSVELAKENQLKKLTGVVNGLLRHYGRLAAGGVDPLQLPDDPVRRLGILYSFPDWIVKIWVEQLGIQETEGLCQWFNQPPHLDLRVNPLRTSQQAVKEAIAALNLSVSPIAHLPQALRLSDKRGAIQKLPGFGQGWWTVQDSSAQLVTHLLDPQPGEMVIDACAAPGGKTTHIAELMEDRGIIWGCDAAEKRLRKLTQNSQRLHLNSIQSCAGDSRHFSQFYQRADRVLLDAPCSGLGTLHKRPDIRWRKTPDTIKELTILQGELLEKTSTWLKPGGVLVYATCTLHRLENEEVIENFLVRHPDWQIFPPTLNSPCTPFVSSSGGIKVWPHRHQMDGFFMIRLKKGQ